MSPRRAVGLSVAAVAACVYGRAVVTAERQYRRRQRAWEAIYREPWKWGLDADDSEALARWLGLRGTAYE